MWRKAKNRLASATTSFRVDSLREYRRSRASNASASASASGHCSPFTTRSAAATRSASRARWRSTLRAPSWRHVVTVMERATVWNSSNRRRSPSGVGIGSFELMFVVHHYLPRPHCNYWVFLDRNSLG